MIFNTIENENEDSLEALNTIKDDAVIQFLCTITEIENKMSGFMCYLMKLAKNTSTEDSLKDFRGTPKEFVSSHCSFEYDTKRDKYVRIAREGEFKESDNHAEDNKASITLAEIAEPPAVENNETLAMKRQARAVEIKILLEDPEIFTIDDIMQSISVYKKNYGDGIVTRQIIKGKIKKAPRQPSLLKKLFSQNEESGELITQVNTSVSREFIVEKARIAKVKKQLHDSQDHLPTPKHITNIQLASLLLLFSFIFLTGLEYGLTKEGLSNVQDSLSLVWMRGQMFELMGQSLNSAIILGLLKQNIITNYENCASADKYETVIRQEMSQTATIVQQQLMDFANVADLDTKFVNTFLYDEPLTMQTFDANGNSASNNTYSIYDSVLLMNDALTTLVNTPLVNISFKNPSLLFLRYNYLNSILSKDNSSRALFVPLLINYSRSKMSNLLEIMIAAFVINLATSLFIFPLF